MSENQKFIKLQEDQVFLFWDLIRAGMIAVYKIPDKHQQDFAINALTNLLSGTAQAWIGFDLDDEGIKRIQCVVTTKMVEDTYYGIRRLHIDSLYGYRKVSPDVPSQGFKCIEEFARANGCQAITAEYFFDKAKEVLTANGFEDHISVCRKIL